MKGPRPSLLVSQVTRAFYKNAVGAIVVCDVTRLSTLEAVALWKKEIDSKVRFPPLPIRAPGG